MMARLRSRIGSCLAAAALASSVHGALAAKPAEAPQGPGAARFRGYVIGNGGESAPALSAGSYQAYATVGQPAVQGAISGKYDVCSGFWCFGGSRVVSVPGDGAAPLAFSLGPATPNPSAGDTRFELALPAAAQVTLTVFDVSGRRIGDAVSRRFDPGRHTLYWRPSEARAGMYFLRLATDGVVRAKRTIVIVK